MTERGLTALARAALFLAAVLLWTAPAGATVKVALVIGNNSYVHAPALSNPVNDAKAVAEVLRRIGFDVIERHDVAKADAEGLMEAFSKKAAKADIGLVYFAGHGIQVSGETYLVPVDVPLESDRDMRRLIPADYFLQDASQAHMVGVVILDACRDNPFIKRLSEATAQSQSITVGRGLSRVDDVPRKGLIAYATQAGNVALDTAGGKNSPYATALVMNLGAPNKDIRLVFGAIRDQVIELTNRQQEPYTYGSLGGDPIYLYEADETKKPSTSESEQPERSEPEDVVAYIPTTQLSTSAPVTSSYVAWKSAIANSSWEELTALSNSAERSLFPLLATELLSVRGSAKTVREALRKLRRQRLDFEHMNPDLAAMVQAQLRDLNYFAGDVDGRVGDDTRAALTAFVADWSGGQTSSAYALVALAERASERTAQSVFTGLWRGRYFYPRPLNGIESVEFEMDLTFSQGQVSGFVAEPNTFGNKTSAHLYATFSGTVVGNQVEWKKTYDGTGGVGHSVLYRGTIDRKRGRIEGRWTISNDWSGNFFIELN